MNCVKKVSKELKVLLAVYNSKDGIKSSVCTILGQIVNSIPITGTAVREQITISPDSRLQFKSDAHTGIRSLLGMWVMIRWTLQCLILSSDGSSESEIDSRDSVPSCSITIPSLSLE